MCPSSVLTSNRPFTATKLNALPSTFASQSFLPVSSSNARDLAVAAGDSGRLPAPMNPYGIILGSVLASRSMSRPWALRSPTNAPCGLRPVPIISLPNMRSLVALGGDGERLLVQHFAVIDVERVLVNALAGEDAGADERLVAFDEDVGAHRPGGDDPAIARDAPRARERAVSSSASEPSFSLPGNRRSRRRSRRGPGRPRSSGRAAPGLR